MNINLVFDAQALAAPTAFRTGMQQAANIIDAAFSDNITINIAVGYGEFLGGALPNQNTSEGNIDFNGNDGTGFSESYQNLRSLLNSHRTSSDDNTAVADLPNTTTLQGRGKLPHRFRPGEGARGPGANDTRLDGAIGMGTFFTGTVLIGGALHELTHAMGRIAGDVSRSVPLQLQRHDQRRWHA